MKAKHEAEMEEKRIKEACVESAEVSEKYPSLKSLIATAPSANAVEEPTTPVPNTPVTMEKTIATDVVPMETQSPAKETPDSQMNISVAGQVTMENLISKQSELVIDPCIDEVSFRGLFPLIYMEVGITVLPVQYMRAPICIHCGQIKRGLLHLLPLG